jgi:hypothetical protein
MESEKRRRYQRSKNRRPQEGREHETEKSNESSGGRF